jgi:predicted TPR repeat methyltransferase
VWKKLKHHAGFSVPTRDFEKLYAEKADPWNLKTSAYDLQKYTATLDALPHHRYSSAFDVGCSVGVMTSLLADRCDLIIAVDSVERALQEARQHCAGKSHVHFARMHIPKEWPERTFDLIVISEVLYYLSAAELEAVVARLRDSLAQGGDLILVHGWQTRVHDLLPFLCKTNRRVGRLITLSNDFAQVVRHERNEHYRLDVLSRASGTRDPTD